MFHKVFNLPFSLGALVLTLGFSQKVTVPKYTIPSKDPFKRFVIGRDMQEITPPPGYPMGGHSISGKVARGYWTRLYARAFYFEDKSGHRLALVSTDLFAIAAGLRLEVCRLAASRGVPLLPDELILSATHTHHGPGNYMTSEVYNGFSSPWPGFDRPMFDFLAGRISDALVGAYTDAGKSSANAHRVVLRVGPAPNLQRNRAIDAFFRDHDGPDLIKDSIAMGMRCPDGTASNCPRFLAADPTLTVLELLRNAGARESRIGVLVFFSIHPTAMSHENELWSSDLSGRAMRSLELEAGPDQHLVAGFFNGAEGDVSARWINQDRRDVINIGDKLADAVRAVIAHPVRQMSEDDPEVLVSHTSFATDGSGQDSAGFNCKPLFGVATLGGAEDGRNLPYYYGWHGGVVADKPKGCQGNKVPGLDLPSLPLLKLLKLTRLVTPSGNFPDKFPVSIGRIGKVLAIGAIPVEMTTMMGRRIRTALATLENPRHFVMAGLANEYFSYVTTPEEYDAQEYEGASTLFGREEGDIISGLLQRVSAQRPAPPDAGATVKAVTFKVGTKPLIPFGPQFQGERQNLLDEDLQLNLPEALAYLNSRAPRFEWDENASGDWKTYARGVSIYQEVAGRWVPVVDSKGLPENDHGADILTVLADGVGKRRWAALWLPPEGTSETSRFRFRVHIPEPDAIVCSQPFALRDLPGVEPARAIPQDTVCPPALQ